MSDQLKLDLGPADVHSPGAVKTKAQELYVSSKQRAKMPARQFADPANKAYPIHDKAHADNAAARLEQQKGSMSSGKYQAIKRRIKAAQRRFGEKPKTAAAAPAKTGGYRIRLNHPGGGSTVIAHHLSASNQNATAIWLPDSRELCAFFPIDKAQALSEPQTDEQGNKRVWIQIARTGAWAGHHGGAFAITELNMDQMIQNFRTQGFGRIQWDFDHASFPPPNSGSLPQVGKPAQGWIYDMKREGSKLYALTEWLPLAKQYLENDQYGGVSPVINWHFADRATGRDVGPAITSVALTNLPFITGMERPTAASLAGVSPQTRGFMPLVEVSEAEAQRITAASAEPCCYYSDTELLGQLKPLFGLHELATVAQCKGALAALSNHLDAVDGDGSAHHEGVELGKYISGLRDMVGGSRGMSSTELVQFIDGILDAYMKANGIEDDDSDLDGLSLSAAPSTDATATAAAATTTTEQPAATTAASVGGASMAEPVAAPAVAVAPAQPAVSADATPAAPATLTAASAVVATEPAAPATTEAPAPAAPVADVSALTLQLHLEKVENESLKARIAALEAAQTENADQALSASVDAAFNTYKDSKKLTPELKPHMLHQAKTDPVGFAAMFPPVDADKQHLLLSLTGGGASNPNAPSARTAADTAAPLEGELNDHQKIIALGLEGLTEQIMEDEGVPFALASVKADQQLRAARHALTVTK